MYVLYYYFKRRHIFINFLCCLFLSLSVTISNKFYFNFQLFLIRYNIGLIRLTFESSKEPFI